MKILELSQIIAEFLRKNGVSSEEFSKDPDKFIELALKNLGVARQNQKVRFT